MSADPRRGGGYPGAESGLAGLGFLLLATCQWGMNWPVMKFLLGELPPFTSRTCTGLLGAAIAFAIAALRRETILPHREQVPRLFLVALLNIAAFMGLATLSMLWLTASEAVIITNTLPLWTGLLAWLLLGERPNAARIGGLVLGAAGVLVLTAAQPLKLSIAMLPGVACALGAAVLFALGTVLTKRAPLSLPLVAGVAWQVLIASGLMLALSLALEHPNLAAVTPLGWACVLYGAVPGLCLAYLCWFRALSLLPAAVAAIGTLMTPVIAVFAAALLLGEPLGARQLTALVLTLGGVLMAARTAAPAPRATRLAES